MQEEKCAKNVLLLMIAVLNKMHTLRASLAKAAEVLLDDMDSDCDPAPPPPKRAAVSLGPSSASPDVTVNKV